MGRGFRTARYHYVPLYGLPGASGVGWVQAPAVCRDSILRPAVRRHYHLQQQSQLKRTESPNMAENPAREGRPVSPQGFWARPGTRLPRGALPAPRCGPGGSQQTHTQCSPRMTHREFLVTLCSISPWGVMMQDIRAVLQASCMRLHTHAQDTAMQTCRRHRPTHGSQHTNHAGRWRERRRQARHLRTPTPIICASSETVNRLLRNKAHFTLAHTATI